jgi:hypothetical protein
VGPLRTTILLVIIAIGVVGFIAAARSTRTVRPARLRPVLSTVCPPIVGPRPTPRVDITGADAFRRSQARPDRCRGRPSPGIETVGCRP